MAQFPAVDNPQRGAYSIGQQKDAPMSSFLDGYPDSLGDSRNHPHRPNRHASTAFAAPGPVFRDVSGRLADILNNAVARDLGENRDLAGGHGKTR
jgi:hypothetical protein